MTEVISGVAALDPPSGVDSPTSSGWRRIERWLAFVLAFGIPVGYGLAYSLSVSVALALVLTPVWLPAAVRFSFARILFATLVACLVSGVLLQTVSAGDHVVSFKYAAVEFIMIVSIMVGIGVVLWCRRTIGTRWLIICFGAGLLFDHLGNPGTIGATNPWKSAYSIPVIIIVLAVFGGARHRMSSLPALAALAFLSLSWDSRSLTATVLLSGVLLVWQMRPTRPGRSSWVWTAALLVGFGAALYHLGTVLIVDGYLGQAAQVRSVAQINESGSLILGGRPEAAATAALIVARPFGYGFGVVPSIGDVNVAKEGMARLNYNPENGYVEHYMFGNTFELHSVAGDLWALFGYFGLGLSLLVLFVIIRALVQQVAHREAEAAFIFLSCYTVWNLFFSPLLTSVPTLLLTVGLSLSAGRFRPEPTPIGAVVSRVATSQPGLVRSAMARR